MKIELWPIDRVRPYPGNLRKISQAAIDKVAVSIAEYGFRQPLVVDKDGVLVVGTRRWLAARKAGLEHVPVHVADSLTPEQVRGYRLMDNRSHEDTGWIAGPRMQSQIKFPRTSRSRTTWVGKVPLRPVNVTFLAALLGRA